MGKPNLYCVSSVTYNGFSVHLPSMFINRKVIIMDQLYSCQSVLSIIYKYITFLVFFIQMFQMTQCWARREKSSSVWWNEDSFLPSVLSYCLQCPCMKTWAQGLAAIFIAMRQEASGSRANGEENRWNPVSLGPLPTLGPLSSCFLIM